MNLQRVYPCHGRHKADLMQHHHGDHSFTEVAPNARDRTTPSRARCRCSCDVESILHSPDTSWLPTLRQCESLKDLALRSVRRTLYLDDCCSIRLDLVPLSSLYVICASACPWTTYSRVARCRLPPTASVSRPSSLIADRQ